jgi:hypothetical protein
MEFRKMKIVRSTFAGFLICSGIIFAIGAFDTVEGTASAEVTSEKSPKQIERRDVVAAGVELTNSPSTISNGAVISVTTANPNANPGDGLCSLIEAINNANSDGDSTSGDCPAGAGHDVIELSSSETYTLTSIHNSTDGANGLPTITSTITMNGHDSTIIRDSGAATQAFRIFHISPSGDLEINDLIVDNGLSDGRSGGGIRNQGGRATLLNSTVRNSIAVDAHGGGIYNVDGHISIISSTISFNQVVSQTVTRSGGGIANSASDQEATVVLTNTVVISNIASRSAGGIGNSASSGVTATVSIYGSQVNSNIADEAAGGIWNTYASDATRATMIVYLENSEVSNNITNNSAGIVGGGGIVNNGDPSEGNLGLIEIRDSFIGDNQANTGSAFGGGIINAMGLMTITGSTISGNVAQSSPDGPFPAGGGGGIVNSDGTLAMANSTISGNQANGLSGGGGILNTQFFGVAPSIVRLINVTISDNSATHTAGGVRNEYFSSLQLVRTVFVNTIVAGNQAPDGIACARSPGTVLQSMGNNLDDGDSCNFNQPTDLINSDPLLGPLENNGGPTETQALLNWSPAIDSGDDASCNLPLVGGVDQRGVFRPIGPQCDIGAYESDAYSTRWLMFLPTILR